MNKEMQSGFCPFNDIIEYNRSIEGLKAGYERRLHFLEKRLSSYSEEKRKHINTEKIFTLYKSYWTIRDIILLWLGQDLTSTEAYKLTNSNPEMIPNLVEQEVFARGMRDLAIGMVTDSVRNGCLEIGYDVIIQNGNVFTDSPGCSIRPPVFLSLVDEKQEIFDGNFPIQIPPIIRQVVDKQDKYNKMSKQKDGELLQSHLKKLFIDDIDAGIFIDDLVKKFISRGKLVSEGSHKYYQYSVNGRDIKTSKNRLKGIALTLLPEN